MENTTAFTEAATAEKTQKEDFEPEVRKAINELVKIFRTPRKPLVKKVTDHYFVIG